MPPSSAAGPEVSAVPGAWSLLRPLQAPPPGASSAQSWGRGSEGSSRAPAWLSPASRTAASPRFVMSFATDLHLPCALSSDVCKQWTAGKALEGTAAARGGGGEGRAWEPMPL